MVPMSKKLFSYSTVKERGICSSSVGYRECEFPGKPGVYFSWSEVNTLPKFSQAELGPFEMSCVCIRNHRKKVCSSFRYEIGV